MNRVWEIYDGPTLLLGGYDWTEGYRAINWLKTIFSPRPLTILYTWDNQGEWK